mmetsp:Transcript_8847/g.21625  ORF Transcript_8847/g.21625 Transcript_8847/m.21625 type:complete len:102 (+) Transcript_8847:169-474(+)
MQAPGRCCWQCIDNHRCVFGGTNILLFFQSPTCVAAHYQTTQNTASTHVNSCHVMSTHFISFHPSIIIIIIISCISPHQNAMIDCNTAQESDLWLVLSESV